MLFLWGISYWAFQEDIYLMYIIVLVVKVLLKGVKKCHISTRKKFEILAFFSCIGVHGQVKSLHRLNLTIWQGGCDFSLYTTST
jgi:hypothetical protein